MRWFLRLIKKLFCCLSVDDENENASKKLLHKNSLNSSSSNDSFPIYAVYPEGNYFRSSSNLSNN
jgi:hypothetical protein